MPCKLCNTQFTLFKRKKACTSCHCFYCTNCLGKARKNTCLKCQTVIEFSKSKNQLMQLKSNDLKFFLQSRKINIDGIVEKEELCNLIINHLNNNAYYEGSTTSSASTPNDFENYAQSFDQIKQTCQSLFTSITDKIALDLQKTTCFNQSNNNNSSQRRDQHPPTQFSASSANDVHVQQQQPSTSDLTRQNTSAQASADCACSDNEDYDERRISEKRESILQQPSTNKRTKLSKSGSNESDTSFEELKSDDDWLLVNQKSKEATSSPTPPQMTETNPQPSTSVPIPSTSTIQSDLNRINIDASTSINTPRNIKVSCRKCGKTKSKIKQEILKLSERLKASNRTEEEINEKIKEFINYLESMKKNDSSEVTETEESQASEMPNAVTQDDIAENVLDENEGINVYASTSSNEGNNFAYSAESQAADEARRFMSLNDIHSNDELEAMSVKQLKEILMLNRVDFRGCCEKNELKERVKRLWESHKSAPPPDQINSDDLCKICMDAPIECVFLECGHSIGCTACGKILSECPICRSYIVRVVRIFKS